MNPTPETVSRNIQAASQHQSRLLNQFGHDFEHWWTDPVMPTPAPRFVRWGVDSHRWESSQRIEQLRQKATHAFLKCYNATIDPIAPRETRSGRFFVFDVNSSFSCGIAESETNHFFDVDECPVPATWVAYLHDPNIASIGPNDSWHHSTCLLCYVIPRLHQVADQGIKVNFVEEIAWLDDFYSQAKGLRKVFQDLHVFEY